MSNLYQESKDDSKPYLQAWKNFYKIWKDYARDILDKAERAGIKDDPENILSNEISSIKNKLEKSEPSIWESRS